jgi:hypothetical protein
MKSEDCRRDPKSVTDSRFGTPLTTACQAIALKSDGWTPDTRHLKPINRAANLLMAKLKY